MTTLEPKAHAAGGAFTCGPFTVAVGLGSGTHVSSAGWGGVWGEVHAVPVVGVEVLGLGEVLLLTLWGHHHGDREGAAATANDLGRVLH